MDQEEGRVPGSSPAHPHQPRGGEDDATAVILRVHDLVPVRRRLGGVREGEGEHRGQRGRQRGRGPGRAPGLSRRGGLVVELGAGLEGPPGLGGGPGLRSQWGRFGGGGRYRTLWNIER